MGARRLRNSRAEPQSRDGGLVQRKPHLGFTISQLKRAGLHLLHRHSFFGLLVLAVLVSSPP